MVILIVAIALAIFAIVWSALMACDRADDKESETLVFHNWEDDDNDVG